MSTPVSLRQAHKFIRDALGDPTGERMQHLLANGRLFKELAQADFSIIDRIAFTASLNLVTVPIAWRPVSEYAAKIGEWNDLRGWGFTEDQINEFSRTLVDHASRLHPTGVNIWLGRDLEYNWGEAMACLEHEVKALGGNLIDRASRETFELSFYPGSEQSGDRKLTAVPLDLKTYGDEERVQPSEVREIEPILPGLEVAWLVALNAAIYLGRGRDSAVPVLWAAGLVWGTSRVLIFSGPENAVLVDTFYQNGEGHLASVACFRK